jgi:hypothetical protein
MFSHKYILDHELTKKLGYTFSIDGIGASRRDWEKGEENYFLRSLDVQQA